MKKRHIMVLRGVTESDLRIDDSVFDKKFTEEAADVRVTPIIYRPMPTTFCIKHKWPMHCNLHCWHCDLLFATAPIPMFTAIRGEVVDGERVFDISGCFCSWSCQCAYINDTFRGARHTDLVELMYLAYEKFNGRAANIIMPSPPRTIMKRYCGEQGMSPEEYKKMVDRLTADTNSNTHKMGNYIVK